MNRMSIRASIALLAPAALVIGLFMVVPILLALAVSLMTADPYGGAHPPLTFSAYAQLVSEYGFDGTRSFSGGYLLIFWRSILLSAATTIAALIVGLPVAWYIACRSPRIRSLLVFLVTLPFWTNLLIRTYCLILIFRDEGLLNHALVGIGAISGPISFLYNDGAILLGLVYSLLPFMVLPIYSTLEQLDPKLIEASHDLYANRFQTFLNVIWPAAKPGVAAGALLVFAPALGSFVVPDLLGGGKVMLLGNLIQNQFSSARNWPFGASLAVILTVIVLVAVWIQSSREEKPMGAAK